MNLIKVFLIAWLIDTSRSVLVLNSEESVHELGVKCLYQFLKMCQKDSLRICDSFNELNKHDTLYLISSICNYWCNVEFVNDFDRTGEVNLNGSSVTESACSKLSCRCKSIPNTTTYESFSREERAVTTRPEFTASSIKTNQYFNDANDDFLQTVINGSRLFDILLRDFPSIFERTGVDPNSESVDEEYYSDLTVPMPEALSENEDLILDQFQEDREIDEERFSTSSSTLAFSNGVSFDVSYSSEQRTNKQFQTRELPSTSDSPVKDETSTLEDSSRVNYSGPRLAKKDLSVLPTPRDFHIKNDSSSDFLALFRSRYPIEDWKSLGFFTEDYFLLINRHWMQFAPPYHSSHYILAVIYFLVMTVGVTGNCLVIFMFLRCRSLRTPANVLVMNLAVSDFFLLAKMPVFIYNSIYFGPALGAIGCELYGFLGALTGTVSIMTLAAIALDRYYVIVYPLDPLRRTTRQRAKVCVLLVWCYGSIFASLPLTDNGFSRYVPEGYLTSCSFDYLDQSFSNKTFILVFFFAAWVIPFSIITFCYSRIYREVISESSGASSRRGQEQEKRKTEIRLAGVVVGVIGLWFFAWTPYAVVALLGVSGNAHLISPLSSMIPALFCKTASCLDPYIYAVTHPRFRREFEKFFCRGEARRRKLEMIHGRTQCWKTDTSQIQGIMIGIQQRRTNDSFSDDDIEEMVVMIDNTLTINKPNTIPSAPRNLCEIPFPPDLKTAQKLQHPSWFASPFSRRDSRCSSLKMKPIKSQSNSQSEPISV